MKNAQATLFFNLAHIPLDIYHVINGHRLFFIALVIGVLLIAGSIVYLYNIKNTQRYIVRYLPNNRLLSSGTSIVSIKNETTQALQRTGK
jgi:hypothetical protein